MNTSDIILAATLLVLASTLVAVAVQAYYARKTFEMTSLQSRYLMFFEIDRMMVEHPHLQLCITNKDAADSLTGADKEILERKSFIELMLDMAEFNYLSSPNSNRHYITSYIERLLTNKHVKEYWNSTNRGSFEPAFVRFIDGLIKRLASRS